MPEFNPPEGLLDLPFGDVLGELDKVIESLLPVLQFVDKFSWFLPAQYKSMLSELNQLLLLLHNFLDKTP